MVWAGSGLDKVTIPRMTSPDPASDLGRFGLQNFKLNKPSLFINCLVYGESVTATEVAKEKRERAVREKKRRKRNAVFSDNSGLSKNGPHRLIYLNAWSPVTV